jgi:hypothetical protein
MPDYRLCEQALSPIAFEPTGSGEPVPRLVLIGYSMGAWPR